MIRDAPPGSGCAAGAELAVRPSLLYTRAVLTFLRSNAVRWGATLLLLDGCVLGLRPDPSAQPSERPAPREETPGPKPRDCQPACRWVPGYWHWDGGGYVWIAGRWERARQPVANSQQ
ncbi:MAG: YXWGXW repeat-containing protein [Myxococcota bacterium]